jgi:hypothetical protein
MVFTIVFAPALLLAKRTDDWQPLKPLNDTAATITAASKHRAPNERRGEQERGE